MTFFAFIITPAFSLNQRRTLISLINYFTFTGQLNLRWVWPQCFNFFFSCVCVRLLFHLHINYCWIWFSLVLPLIINMLKMLFIRGLLFEEDFSVYRTNSLNPFFSSFGYTLIHFFMYAIVVAVVLFLFFLKGGIITFIHLFFYIFLHVFIFWKQQQKNP